MSRHIELSADKADHAGSHCHDHICHDHNDHHCAAVPEAVSDNLPYTREILTIRANGGLSGDMALASLAFLALFKKDIEPESEAANKFLNEIFGSIMPELEGSAKLERREVNGIQGWHMRVALQKEHSHRNLDSIAAIIEASGLVAEAKKLGLRCFQILAECEAAVHGKPVNAVHFHEAGALDSILDICGSCALYAELGFPELVASPLPLADGAIHCAHGTLPAPAPAVLRLLKGVPARSYAGPGDAGELVTPTAIALLLALNASFGSWPAIRVTETAIAYGDRIIENGPNGAIFALGDRLEPGNDV